MNDVDRLTDRQFYKGDPLLVLLRDRLRLEDGWIIAGSALLTAAAVFGVPALFGIHANLPQLIVGLLETFLIIPLGLLIYLSLPNVFDDVFNALRDNHLIGGRREEVAGPESYAALLKALVFQANRRVWVVGALGLPAVYWIYRLGTHVSGDTTAVGSPEAQLAQRLAVLIAYSPGLYSVFFSVVRLLIALVFTVRLFRSFTIQVNPLHPDGSGGLAVIGRLLLVSVLIATAIGATAVVMSLLQLSSGLNPLWRMETLLLGAIYVLLTPLLLFGWLWTPHRAMQEARDRVLKSLADEFRQSIQRTMPSAQDDAAGVKAGTERLDEIKRRYDFLRDSFPVWPIQGFVSRGLVATSILPFLSTVISGLIPSVQEALQRLFKGP